MKVIQHPLGFLKVIIWEEEQSALRFHAWDDHLAADIDIHQHRASFTSTVLEGSMNEELWAYTDDPAGGWDRLTVHCSQDGDVYHVDEKAPSVRCRVQVKELFTHKAGETYHRPATDLHRVLPVRLPLVTLVRVGPVCNEVHTILRKRNG